MWPFNKKEEPAVPQTAKTLIYIPGTWESYEQFRDTIIVSTEGKYMMMGDILMNAENNTHFNLEFLTPDPDMARSFSRAGLVNGLSEAFIDKIAQHNYVVALSADTGHKEAAKNIANAAAVVLRTGGIGVKIDSTGLAFDKDTWLEMMDNYENHHLYRLYVLDCIVDSENDSVYTCGMHNVGLRDAIVEGHDPQEAIDLLRIFGVYQVEESPVLQHGQTFQAALEAPVYRIFEEEEQPYEKNDLFYNPYGRWRLVKVEE